MSVLGYAPCPDLEEEPNFDNDKQKANKQQLKVEFYKRKLTRGLGFKSPFSPIYNRCGDCKALVAFCRMLFSYLEIDSVGVECVCVKEPLVDKFLKAKVGEDWVCIDVFSCVKKMDYRDFNLDDGSFNLTHEPVGDQIDDTKFFYPRCATMKLSYYSIMNTLITSMNLD